MDFDFGVAEEAAKRWQSRMAERDPQRAKLESGLVADSHERIQKRLNRLTAALTKETSARVTTPGTSFEVGEMGAAGSERSSLLIDTVGVERVIGKTDFLGLDFLELALAISRFVGRIQIRTSPGRTAGLGTGFMVSPRLLLTNNHVLRSAQDALHSEVEFDYQYDRFGRLLPVVVYGLEPQTFFMTSKELDFSLIAVREQSLNGVELTRYGWSRLIAEEGKVLLGDSLNIIQHPKGEAKQIVLRSNQLVDLFKDFAHYVTDTEPGSSGSPVYNDQWEVVALHHSGVPKIENGNYIAKDGSIWKPGMDPDDLMWVANEGVRISSLVEHIKKAQLTPEQARMRDEMLNAEPPHPFEAASLASKADAGVQPMSSVSEQGSCMWTIPLQVTVSIGTPSNTPHAASTCSIP